MLLGQHGTFDPKGVRVRSVRVSGPLDLDNVSARAGLSLISCVVNGEISAWHANLPWLRLAHCRVGNVHADGARLESGMWLDDLRIAGAGSAGAVRLPKARIGNRLDLSRTEITNSTGAALFAPGLHVDGDLWLDETRFDAATRWAAVQLFQARIDGVVSLRKARIFNAAGTAFQLTN
ncbi:hypothetical protein SAMN05421837_107148 [Amycolatopsis pretoriensis]|uniref:Pentapeptide repeat-containing protein n=2 Tax=Amycolatopsis pretoriensis TaxID=218821 RepID=A0A1H5R6P1_9PSEU|nr:hypothetical protein SAMN05421837_107148 [Amycolatopsis pretoriensis]